MLKRVCALLLVIVIMLTVSITAFADTGENSQPRPHGAADNSGENTTQLTNPGDGPFKYGGISVVALIVILLLVAGSTRKNPKNLFRSKEYDVNGGKDERAPLGVNKVLPKFMRGDNDPSVQTTNPNPTQINSTGGNKGGIFGALKSSSEKVVSTDAGQNDK